MLTPTAHTVSEGIGQRHAPRKAAESVAVRRTSSFGAWQSSVVEENNALFVDSFGKGVLFFSNDFFSVRR